MRRERGRIQHWAMPGNLVGGNEEHKTDGERINKELGGKLRNEEIGWFSSLLKCSVTMAM